MLSATTSTCHLKLNLKTNLYSAIKSEDSLMWFDSSECRYAGREVELILYVRAATVNKVKATDRRSDHLNNSQAINFSIAYSLGEFSTEFSFARLQICDQ